MQQTFHINPATNADLEELANLVNSAYRGAFSKQGWTTESDYIAGQRTNPRLLREHIGAPKKAILCLREKVDGPILSSVALEGIGEKKTYFGMLTVKPDIQSKGLGSAILQAAENFAKEKGAAQMFMGVIFLRDKLMEWYERRGYYRTGETEAFPYGDDEVGIPQRDDLYFIMFEKNLN